MRCRRHHLCDLLDRLVQKQCIRYRQRDRRARHLATGDEPRSEGFFVVFDFGLGDSEGGLGEAADANPQDGSVTVDAAVGCVCVDGVAEGAADDDEGGPHRVPGPVDTGFAHGAAVDDGEEYHQHDVGEHFDAGGEGAVAAHELEVER